MPARPLLLAEHARYLRELAEGREFFGDGERVVGHLALPGAYWCLAAMQLLGEELRADARGEVLAWVARCRRPDGGYGGGEAHDSNLLATLYALLVLLLLGAPLPDDAGRTAEYVLSLLDEAGGGFRSDAFGDVDGRTTYAGIYCLFILGGEAPRPAREFLARCANLDGGFGGKPGAESHAAYTFCAALGLVLARERFDCVGCGLFLARRQTAGGGLNGRPEKLPDVCYSWWVLSTLAVLGAREDVDLPRLADFILECQQPQGGFGDRPGNAEDVFHTFFALAALALIDAQQFGLRAVDPLFSLPHESARALRMRVQGNLPD